MRLREGKVESINGDMAVVLTASRKREVIEIKRLRRDGQKSELTEFLDTMFEANRKNA